MSRTDFDRFVEACNYPGTLDVARVHASLEQYLQALKAPRKIVRIEAGWELEDHPSLERNVLSILEEISKNKNDSIYRDARAARAARDARDARDALAALAARAVFSSLKRFAQWCIQGSGTGWWWWAPWDLSWISTTYFGAVQIDKPEVQAWSKPLLEAFCAGCWFLYWTDDTLYWVAKPVVHKESDQNTWRLHNATYAAIESDVENLYFWHGVIVPAFAVTKPEWITIKHIDTEQNAEVRRVLVERYGQARYLVDAGAKEIHRDDYGILYRREIPGDEPLVMVKVVNSTAEPDGTFKDYFLRVPPDMKRAHQAVAWTFGKEEKDYAPEVQT